MEEDSKKKAWKSDSIDGALLYLLFHYQVFNPDDYSAAEIYQHPKLPFKSYCKKNFNSYCQTIANRCLKFKRTQTGLSKVFKEQIVEAKKEYASVLSKLTGTDVSAEDDQDQDDQDQDDQGEEELGHTIRNTQFEKQDNMLSDSNSKSKGSGRASGKTASAAGSTSTAPVKTKTLFDPYVIAYDNGEKLFCQIPLGGNTERDEDFKVTLQAKGIQLWLRVPAELEDAYELLGSAGRISDHKQICIHCNAFQSAINQRMKNDGFQKDKKGRTWALAHDIETPFEIKNAFYDKYWQPNGKKFLVQSNGFGYYYVQFWLKGAAEDDDDDDTPGGVRVGKAKRR